MTHFEVLIVGAGQAGAQVAISLRMAGFDGSIALVGAEPDAPYERPPLSKEFLAGDKTAERLQLRPADFWATKAITLRLGERVTSVDAATHSVATDKGAALSYRHLVWATGGPPRALPVPGGDLAGVHVIRTRIEVEALRREAATATNIVIVGGGYIGLEAAAVLAKQGKHVTVLEAMDRVLARVAGEPVSRFYEARHRAHGVTIMLDAKIIALEGDGRVNAVRTAGGTLPADLVIVGIGIVPAIAELAAAGAKVSNGVEVDDLCRTSLPDVFAVGDCAHHVNSFAHGGDRSQGGVRLESVQNAIDQAKTVASVITGAPKPYHAVPWFWSNQYDLKLQTVGLSGGHDASVVRGDPASGSWSLVYLKQGRVIALDCINAARDFVQGKALVDAGVMQGLVVDVELLKNTDVPLKSLLPAA
ncbi:MAG: NAD(P)/FAD-dependent oxidoreductase [Polymorphobacter sp.]